MSRKLKPILGSASAGFHTGVQNASLFARSVSAVTIVSSVILACSSPSFAESSLPVSGDDPLAWLERPVDCALTSEAVDSRYGALLNGAVKNPLLSEEFKFVSSETCSGKRFASCKFSWCKGAPSSAAEAIDGKVKQFSKEQSEVTTRGWNFDEVVDAEEDAVAENAAVPAANLVAAAANDTSSRAALRNPVVGESIETNNGFVPPRLVLGKNAVPTLPGGEVVKGIKRVNGSFLPVSYEVPEKQFEHRKDPVVPETVVHQTAPISDTPPPPAPVAVVVPEVDTAKAAVQPAPAPRVVSLVDNAEIALRSNAERELIEIEKKLRDKLAGRIEMRLADEKSKNIAWKVIEVPGASARASFGRGATSEAVQIKGAVTSEYSRSIVPGIGKAPANTVSAEDQFLSKYNATVLPVERFKHSTPPLPGTPTIESTTAKIEAARARIDKLSAEPKVDYGVAVPLEAGDLDEIGKMRSFRARPQ